jgi:hypothetical protein
MPADTEADALDERALALRTKGTGFRTIANELGLERASDANLAFNRALRRLPEEQRATVRREEGLRLDRLADVTRSNSSLTPTDIERRLKGIDRLRAQLNTD